MASFVYVIIQGLLSLIMWAIIVNAVFSWLIAFEVVNTRNRFVYQFVRFLDAVTYPILAPVRRVIPPLGGMDISPIILILVIGAAKSRLLPWAFQPLIGLAG